MTKENLVTFALAYAAIIVIISVYAVVKYLYFNAEVKRKGDEIEVDRWVNGRGFLWYKYNIKTKEQTLYILKNGEGRIYYADWRGVVKKISDPSGAMVMERKEFDQKVIAGQLHPAMWVIFKNDISDLNEEIQIGKLFDNYFRRTIEKYRLRQYAIDYLEEMEPAEGEARQGRPAEQ